MVEIGWVDTPDKSAREVVLEPTSDIQLSCLTFCQGLHFFIWLLGFGQHCKTCFETLCGRSTEILKSCLPQIEGSCLLTPGDRYVRPRGTVYVQYGLEISTAEKKNAPLLNLLPV